MPPPPHESPSKIFFFHFHLSIYSLLNAEVKAGKYTHKIACKVRYMLHASVNKHVCGQLYKILQNM